MIGKYPNLTQLELADLPLLQPEFRRLKEGLSEMSFAGIYCFRHSHGYRIARLADETVVLAGTDKDVPFFVCPFDLPRPEPLHELFDRFRSMKLVTEAQGAILTQLGYAVSEDRDNFDYLYRREDLATLHGRALQKKRNLVHVFERTHAHQSAVLAPERVADALTVLEAWRAATTDQADYAPAKEALEQAAEFGLEGRVYYVESQPVGYTLGEPSVGGSVFVVHYEKTVPHMKGLYQLINMDFARSLPETVTLINREQDLGDEGLRQAKLTYRPCGFVRKLRAVVVDGDPGRVPIPSRDASLPAKPAGSARV